MRAIKTISTFLVVTPGTVIVFFLIVSLLNGNNNTNTIPVMLGCVFYYCFVMWLLYGFTGSKNETTLLWLAFGLALLPIILFTVVVQMLAGVVC